MSLCGQSTSPSPLSVSKGGGGGGGGGGLKKSCLSVENAATLFHTTRTRKMLEGFQIHFLCPPSQMLHMWQNESTFASAMSMPPCVLVLSGPKTLTRPFLCSIKAKHEVHIETEGKPGEAICKIAKQKHAQQIVMGSRGLGMIRRTLLGSVSQHVINHAHIPVTVIPHED